MDIEFHYWITGMVAKGAGFSSEDARVIAYSSQYVDDNTRYLHVRDTGTNAVFKNRISQTLDIGKPLHELMHTWPVFHFLPGDPAAPSGRRKDGMAHVMNTTADSPRAWQMLEAAFEDDSPHGLHRIGVATHTFADTWAHQNFVGCASEFNNLPGVLLLNIGHLDAVDKPDKVLARWSDERLVDSRVDNNKRYLEAARRLWEEYRRFLGQNGNSWDALARELKGLMARTAPDRRKYYANKLAWLGPYRDDAWLLDAARDEPEAFSATMGRYQWKTEKPKEQTNWFCFQQAVNAHHDLGVQLLEQLYADTGVEVLARL